MKWIWHALTGPLLRGIAGRSPHWKSLEKSFLHEHPLCAGCGAWLLLNVHHVIPFHVDPSKELDPANLITLCEGRQMCHFILGHHRNWRDCNPNVRADAAKNLARIHGAE